MRPLSPRPCPSCSSSMEWRCCFDPSTPWERRASPPRRVSPSAPFTDSCGSCRRCSRSRVRRILPSPGTDARRRFATKNLPTTRARAARHRPNSRSRSLSFSASLSSAVSRAFPKRDLRATTFSAPLQWNSPSAGKCTSSRPTRTSCNSWMNACGSFRSRPR